MDLTKTCKKVDKLARTLANMSETDHALTLAPAAGSGIGAQLAKALLSDPDFLPAMVQAAKDGLHATRSFYDKGAGGVVTEPDNRTRIQTLALLLAHMEGEPIKRVIHEFRKGGVDPTEALSSPAALEAAERMIAGAKAHARKVKSQAKQVEPVTVDVEA